MATKKGPSKKRVGRKPLPESVRKSEPFQIKLSEDDRRLINAAAALDEDKPYPWSRRMIVLAARQRLQAAGMPLPTAPAARPKK